MPEKIIEKRKKIEMITLSVWGVRERECKRAREKKL